MTVGTDTLHFYYDALNRPVFVDFNGTTYAYHYSMQGDVLGFMTIRGRWWFGTSMMPGVCRWG